MIINDNEDGSNCTRIPKETFLQVLPAKPVAC